jgi:co-chaperonin GroES (HSP10)
MTQLMDQLRDSVAMLSDGKVQITGGETLNPSGIVPFDHRVLLLHDPVEAAHKTTSGFQLLKTDQEMEKEKYAQTKATVIAVGDMAWGEARYDAQRFGLHAAFPEAGSRVVVGRYAGNNYDGRDGKTYTVVNDTEIIAFLESEG